MKENKKKKTDILFKNIHKSTIKNLKKIQRKVS